MGPHVHISPVQMLVMFMAFIAVLGTAHLLAISNDNRASRAWVSLGF